MSGEAGLRSPSLIRRSLRIVERLLAAVGLAFILYHLTIDLRVMTSPSMAPALQGASYDDGDWIVLEKVTRWWRDPRRWEVHFYYDLHGTPVTKRVVGLPGERIALDGENILINGLPLARPESVSGITYYPFGNLRTGEEVDCGTGYFMLGDDSVDSQDSRFTGVIAPEELRSRAWLIIWPPSRIGLVR